MCTLWDNPRKERTNSAVFARHRHNGETMTGEEALASVPCSLKITSYRILFLSFRVCAISRQLGSNVVGCSFDFGNHITQELIAIGRRSDVGNWRSREIDVLIDHAGSHES